jgi:LPXTG-motif cell wall-anchored protein
MHVPQRLAALAIAALLAAPGTALAQSAGDNQYQDPFGNQGSGGGSGSGSSGSNSGSGSSGGGQSGDSQGSGSGSGQSADTGSSQTSSSTGTTDAQGSQTTAGRQLPRTGAEPGLVALLGAGVTFGGLALRRRVRRPSA